MNELEILDYLSKLQAVSIEYRDYLLKFRHNVKITATINQIISISSHLKQIILNTLILSGKTDYIKRTQYGYFTPHMIFSDNFENYDMEFIENNIIPSFHPNKYDAVSFINSFVNLTKNSRIGDLLILSKRAEQLGELILNSNNSLY